MSETSESLNKIEDLYKNLTYTDQYATSIIVFVVLMLVFFIICSYYYIEILKQPIKDDWANKRCSPMVIPFAGIINKPADQTIMEFTNNNFQYCVQNSVKTMSGYFLQPLTYITNNLQQVSAGQQSDINSSRGAFNNVRGGVSSISNDVYARMLNIMVPIQQMIVTFKDFMAKIQGIMAASLYTLLGSYFGLESLFGSILQISKLMLITLSAVIAMLWLFVFTWPSAAAMTALYAAVAIPLAVIITWAQKHMPGPTMKCFDSSTMLLKEDRTSYIPINEVHIGDNLCSDIRGVDNIVTAIIKVETKGSHMYKIKKSNDYILVSDSHRIYYKNKLIPVSEYPDAIPMTQEEMLEYQKKEPYLYCLNTSRKKIVFMGDTAWDSLVFSDWDDLSYDILDKHWYNPEEVHECLDKGFDASTLITLNTGEENKISNIKIGSILKNGEKVYGTVEILGNSYSNNNPMYHLLTNTGKFMVNNNYVSDYNSCVDEKIIF